MTVYLFIEQSENNKPMTTTVNRGAAPTPPSSSSNNHNSGITTSGTVAHVTTSEMSAASYNNNRKDTKKNDKKNSKRKMLTKADISNPTNFQYVFYPETILMTSGQAPAWKLIALAVNFSTEAFMDVMNTTFGIIQQYHRIIVYFFRHKAHIGWDQTSGMSQNTFNNEPMDDTVRALLRAAGQSPEQMNPEELHFAYKFIEDYKRAMPADEQGICRYFSI